MQAGGGEQWDLGCKARAVTVCCVWLRAARLSELLPSPEDPVGSGGTSQRCPPFSRVTAGITVVLAQGPRVAHRACAILRGP